MNARRIELRNPTLRYTGLRTGCGLNVLRLAEVLPMASDALTVLSFVVFCTLKMLPVISQFFQCVSQQKKSSLATQFEVARLLL